MSSAETGGTVLRVSESADWARVNETLAGFEDAIIREVWVESGRSLTLGDRVVERGFWRAVVLVQLQSASIRAAGASRGFGVVHRCRSGSLPRKSRGSGRRLGGAIPLMSRRGESLRGGTAQRRLGRPRSIPVERRPQRVAAEPPRPSSKSSHVRLTDVTVVADAGMSPRPTGVRSRPPGCRSSSA